MKKWFIIAALSCIMSLAVYGCGKEGEDSREEQGTSQEEEQQEPEAPSGETPSEDTADQEPADEASGEKEEGNTGTKERKEGGEDLTGDIREISDGQFIVVAAFQEELEDGSTLIAISAEGADDSEFEKVTVTYDEHTDFYVRTIYDNGARYEDQDADESALKEEAMVLVWGTYEADGTKLFADQVQIEQFVH